ncbi:MAG: hypothetical protein ACFWUM_00595 [Eubacteriales bacterium]
MFTLAFVFDVVQAEQMLEVGADVICVDRLQFYRVFKLLHVFDHVPYAHE